MSEEFRHASIGTDITVKGLDKLNDANSGIDKLQKKAKDFAEYMAKLKDSFGFMGNVKRDADENTSSFQRMQAQMMQVQRVVQQVKGGFDTNNRAIIGNIEQMKKLHQETMNFNSQSIDKVNQSLKQSSEATKQTTELVKKLHEEISQVRPSGFDETKGGTERLKNSTDETTKSVHRLRDTAVGTFVGGMLTNGISSITSGLKAATVQGFQFASAGADVTKKWHSAGLNDSQTNSMIAQMKDIRTHADIAAGSIVAMQKKYLGMTGGDVGKAQQLTSSVTAFSRDSQMDDRQQKMLDRMMTSSKINAGMFTKTISSGPLREELVKMSGMTNQAFTNMVNSGKFTGQQLTDLMVKASKDSGKAWNDYLKTDQGKADMFKSTVADTKKAFDTNVSSKLFESIQKIVGNGKDLKEVQTTVKGIATSLGTQIGDGVGKAIGFITKNESTLKSIGSSVWQIVKAIGSGVWDTFKVILNVISGNSGKAKSGLKGVSDALSSIAKHKTALKAVGSVLAGIFVASKVAAFGKTLVGLTKSFKVVTIATKVFAAAQAVLNGVMSLNPVGMIILGVTALATGLYELYKHCKPFRKFVNWLGKSALVIIKSVVDFCKPAFKAIGKVIGSVAKAGKKSFHDMWSGMKQNAKDNQKNLENGTKVFGDIFKGHFSDLKKDVPKLLSGMFKTVQDVFKAGFNVLNDLTGGLLGKLTHTLTGWGKSIINFFKGIWDSILGGIKKVGKFMGGLWNGAKGLAGKLTGHAKGGPITKTQMALVNEQGPESAYDSKKGTFRMLGNGKPVVTKLFAGEHVFTAEQTHQLLHGGLNHKISAYAKGTGAKLPSMHGINSTVHVKFDGHGFKSAMLTTRKYVKQIATYITKAYKGINSSSNKMLKTMSNQSEKLWKSMNKSTTAEIKAMDKQLDKIFKSISNQTVDQLKNMSKQANQISDNLNDKMTDNAKDLNKQLNGVWKSIVNDFKDIFAKLSTYAHAGMSGAVTQLNGGIKGINSSLSQFGGNSSVLKPIHYAKGSNGVINHDHLAIVNDAISGPRQEAIVRNNKLFMPNGRNVMIRLQKGDQVLNGRQTEMVKAMSQIKHYAKGSGVSDNHLRDIADKNAKNPSAAWASDFASKIHASGSNLQKGITNDSASGAKTVGIPWYKAMWNLISGLANGGSGSKSAFLNYAMQHFTGKPYVLGADGPTAFDCSGMVSKALEHFGINIGRTTTAMQSSSGLERIGRDIHKTQAGDLALFGHGTGAAGHVGIVNSPQKATIFNETPPRARTTPLSYITALPLDAFYRVKGLHNTDDKKKGSFLDKLVKKQLGKRAMNWISDKLAPSYSADTTGPAPTGDHSHWLKQAGIPQNEWAGYNYIISHESTWNPRAENSSGAYGLPQSLPGNKMASVGSDWRTNPITQLRWMKKYVNKYGGINGAVKYWEQHHCYANGGWSDKPAVFGEVKGEPEVAINPKRDSADRLIKEAVNARSKHNPSIKNMFNNSRNSKPVKVDYHPTINISGKGKTDKQALHEALENNRDELINMLKQAFCNDDGEGGIII